MTDPTKSFYTSPEATLVLTTSVAAFLSGFVLGVYSIRGYVVPRSWAAERERNLRDPVESDESDVDEGDTLLDHAPNWANAEDADRRQGLRVRKGGRGNSSNKKREAEAEAANPLPRDALADTADSKEECKLVLVVRTDLGMTKGKIAAQCSHATLACYKALSQRAGAGGDAAAASILRRWERLGQAKIAVQVKSEAELLGLMSRARGLGLAAEVIQDAGRTQIDPGSLTVLGVGPGPRSLVDQVTGGLKLL
ncbi:peptidyl-tRNA hydrolase PTH2-domain-containing protein [Biscogniauxia mediterranea]|nr:peptidyl-tRNA hydrolase PTH2-domain-containing protein [Biscogniauxia mediterranea]